MKRPNLIVLPKAANANLVFKHKDHNKFEVYDIDVTSHSKNWAKEFSPFFLPVKYKGKTYPCFENFWQYHKVYADHLDLDSNITRSWFKWHESGIKSAKAVRYPMGKGAAPEFSLFNGKRLSYVEARRKIYMKYYARSVVKTEAFQILKEIYRDKTHNIVLRDFDTYDHQALGLSYYDVIHNTRRKMGHAFVIAMMLELGERFYKNFE